MTKIEKRKIIFETISILRKKGLLNEESILIHRRTPEEREKNYKIAIQKQIQQYIKNGCKGDLDFSGTPITSLPNNLKVVRGHLNLRNTQIISIQNILKVEGSLSLQNTLITSLPDNLKVGWNLWIRNTPFVSLPNNLEVAGILDLDDTLIDSLPKNLKVGKNLYLANTPLSKNYSESEIKQMCKIGGKIFF